MTVKMTLAQSIFGMKLVPGSQYTVMHMICDRHCTVMTVKMSLAQSIFGMKLVHGSQYTAMHIIYDTHCTVMTSLWLGFGLGTLKC